MAFAERDDHSWRTTRRQKRRSHHGNLIRLGNLEDQEDVVEFPVFPPKDSFLDSSGRILVKPSVFPQEEITLFEKTEPEIRRKSKKKRNTAVAGALVAAYLAAVVGGSAEDNNSAWNEASKPPAIFLEENRELFSNVNMGCSFAPEQFGVTLQNLNTKYGRNMNNEALNALNYLQKDLNMKDIRIGIRWDNVYNSQGKFDFSLYKPYFDSLVKNKANITLNFGIKVFRWPEDHVPQKVLDGIDEPAKGSTVYPADELSKKSLSYAKDLFSYLEATYTKEQLKQVTIIQPNNEPDESYGNNGWKMDKDYENLLIEEAIKTFPDARILINSAGFLNLNEISSDFKDLITKDPQLKNNLILGVDYYPIDVGSVDVPVIGKVDPENIPIFGKVDPVFYAEILGNRFQNAITDSREVGYQIEVTELQAEPWDGNPTLPGDPGQDFKYATIRAAERILDPNAKNSVIRVWGIEYLIKNPTAENKAILEIIKEINTKT